MGIAVCVKMIDSHITLVSDELAQQDTKSVTIILDRATIKLRYIGSHTPLFKSKSFSVKEWFLLNRVTI